MLRCCFICHACRCSASVVCHHTVHESFSCGLQCTVLCNETLTVTHLVLEKNTGFGGSYVLIYVAFNSKDSLLAFFPPTSSSFKDFSPIYVLGSSWGSSLENTISQRRSLVRVIRGRYYSSDVLCESGLLDSRALLAGARDKSHLCGMRRHTCSTVKNTPFQGTYRWRRRNDRFVYL